MLGTIVNTGAIIMGTIVGCVVKKGIKEEYQGALFNAMGFAATALGINAIVSHMSDSNYPVLFIVSLAIGSLIGSMINIDEKFQKLVGLNKLTHMTNIKLNKVLKFQLTQT